MYRPKEQISLRKSSSRYYHFAEAYTNQYRRSKNAESAEKKVTSSRIALKTYDALCAVRKMDAGVRHLKGN